MGHRLARRLVTLLLILGLSTAACGANLDEARFERVDAARFAQLIAQAEGDPNIILLDLRTAEEVATGYLAGAINLDALDDQFLSVLEKLDPDNHHLVYGRSNASTTDAVRSMKTLGFTHITELNGGMPEWLSQHRPVTIP